MGIFIESQVDNKLFSDDVESQTLDQQLLEAEAEDLDFQSKIQAYDLLTAEEEQLEAEIAENDKDYEDKYE